MSLMTFRGQQESFPQEAYGLVYRSDLNILNNAEMNQTHLQFLLSTFTYALK